MYIKSIKSSLINGIRVDTLEVRFPRIILPEFNTHRVFSRNFQSSRAKPILKVISEDLTYTPSDYGWRKNSKGMSPSELFGVYDSSKFSTDWKLAKEDMIKKAIYFHEEGVAKEIVNRLLEPFMEVTGVVTSTEWNNFLILRLNEGAQTEIRVLAKMIKDTLDSTTPIVRDFHLPYTEDIDEEYKWSTNFSQKDLIQQIKQSVARCARVSYFSFDKKESELDKDIELFNRLKESKHLSPFEHIVLNKESMNFLFPSDDYIRIKFREDDLNGNFYKGVIQFRKLIEIGVEI